MTFASHNQFWYFTVIFAFGSVCGLLYEPFYFLSKITKNKIILSILNVTYCVIFAILTIVVRNNLRFCGLRGYMLIGVVGGFLCYLVSFHNIIAFLFNMVYNNTIR